ncbi:MAG: DNA-3-methyladenine glycosylase 2 family protein [Ruminococcus sp.]|nr:DNA-3-methyladenine glycosylase 2 family protein [Ruminococcus sp.]
MEQKIIFENITDLNLKETFHCGQCFRFAENEDGSFSGVVRGRAVTAEKNGNTFILHGAKEADRALWEDYFDLHRDYGDVKRKLSDVHPIMKEAASYASGIRILSQDPFEALITFIISQNNNIKRITGIIDRLCICFGEEISANVYAFPTAEALAALTEDDLTPIRAGFRHKYILDAAKKVSAGEIDLESLRGLPYEDARHELMKIKGVGIKVADCVLLYGLHRLDAFPMDVWMKRAMKELFDGMDPAIFGEYAGIAQQYIFHYSRMHPELFK